LPTLRGNFIADSEWWIVGALLLCQSGPPFWDDDVIYYLLLTIYDLIWGKGFGG